MQPTISIRGLTRPVARKHARRTRPALRRVAARSMRASVAAAFRAMAHGVDGSSAYASTVEFYRSGGQEWTKQLG